MNELENESLYRALVENSPDAIVLTDLHATILRANPAAGELFGVPARELLGTSGLALLAPEERADGTADIRAFLDTGAQQNFEYTFLRADGSRARVEVRASIWRDATDTPQGFVVIARDISARKRFEDALRASETRFRTSVENMLDAFGIYSALRDDAGRIVDFQIEYVNAAACASNQMSKDAQIGKRLCDILPAHRATGLFDEYCRVVETGASFGKEMLAYEDVYGAQRLARAFDVRAVKLGDGFAAAWRDVTEMKRAQEELVWRNKELATLNSIISALAQARPRDQMLNSALELTLHAFDLDGGAIYLLDAPAHAFAPVAARGIDPAREEIIAAQIRAGVNPASAQLMEDARAPFAAVIPLQTKDESVGVMFLFGAQLLDERALQFLLTLGQQIGVAVENTRLAEQTREIDVLREMDRLRAELVANVSHELRTPLGLIKLFITALLNQPEKFDLETEREFLTNIDDETNKLTHIVDNLLDLSRIQAGRLRLDKRATDLCELAREIGADLASQPSQHHLQYTFDAPLVAAVDAKRIAQVLRNLLQNALKYSPHGGAIILSGRVGMNEIIFQVRDHGIGIPASDLERVFERFYRVENSVTQTIDGVGLGLAVCRGIIQAHGGKIWAESALGQGSTFSFTVPRDAESERV